MDISSLAFPRKSHRKIISYPQESTELAELMGIIAGDGGINNNWQLVITLNSIADKIYSQYVANLCKKLFQINVKVRRRKGMNALVVVCTSTSMVDYLVAKGAIRGNKILHQIGIPSWILSNPLYARKFVRGVVDTDGCLYIHKHTIRDKFYNNIGFCFTSKSKRLIYSVAQIFEMNHIKPHLTQRDSRIYLYSESAVKKYLAIFGTSNPRIRNVYQKWSGVMAE